jgi:N-acetylglucosaminyl-diphospho-decaprenol L-rhamnosyltransferase
MHAELPGRISSTAVEATAIDLSVVIVNWNVRDLLARCLRSILDSARLVAGKSDDGGSAVWRLEGPDLPPCSVEVIVVDSASEDGSVEMVRRDFPRVGLYASQENLGYTGGNNLGIRASRGRYVLLLNPDTEVLGAALPAMVAYMDAHPEVGALGPQLLWPDGSVQSSRRRFPSLATALVESTFLQKWFPRNPVLVRYYVLDRPDDAVSEVGWVSGACLLARRAAIDAVGLLDDGYFMYSEEMDWQKRMQGAGWRVVYYPAAQVVHHEGKSSEQVVALRHIRFGRSKVRYFNKHHGPLAGGVVRGWLLVNYFHEWSVEAAKWCLGHKRALRRERMGVYAEVLRSGLKPEERRASPQSPP